MHRRERLRSKVDDLALTLAELEHGWTVGAHQTAGVLLDPVEAAHAATLVAGMGPPPSDMIPQGAFAELQGTLVYASDRCDLAPFDIGQLSLPGRSFRPGKLSELLQPEATRDVERMLTSIVLPRRESEARMRDSGLLRAYSDLALRSRRMRCDLVCRLVESGLAELSA